VAAAGAAEVGLFHELADFSAEDVGIKSLAVAGEEEGFFVLAEGQFGAAFFEVFLEPVKGAVADGGDAVFVAFSFSDLEGLALLIEVGDFEAGEFTSPDSAAVKEFEDGAVSDTEGVADVGEVEYFPYLVEAECLLGEPLFRAREFDFTGGVREDEVLLAEVFEEVSQGA
jgi:hypothetical protein